MIEKLNQEGIAQLLDFSGTRVNNLLISIQAPGTLIRVVTKENKCYVFEVIDPKAKTAHVARCKPVSRKKAYLGVHTVTSLLQVGDIIECANDFAFEPMAPLKQIERLDPIIN